MYKLLTLVDRLDFLCKRKRKSILVTKNEKKKIKSLLWLRAGYLYRKIVLSDPVEGRSITCHSLRLRSLDGRSPHRDDDAYLLFINTVFVNITKHLKLAFSNLLWLRASYLYRKIVLSDPVEGRSITCHSLRLQSLDDDAYL